MTPYFCGARYTNEKGNQFRNAHKLVTTLGAFLPTLKHVFKRYVHTVHEDIIKCQSLPSSVVLTQFRRLPLLALPAGMVQLVNDRKSVLKDALATFTEIHTPEYANKYIASSGKIEEMSCECHDGGDRLCGPESNCINRLTCIECSGSQCGCSKRCANRRFQRHQYARLDVFRAGKKGYGVRAEMDISRDTFIQEYVGEVVDEARFQRRREQYEKDGERHFYFMMLSPGEYIDATQKGSIARFCNHSCNPNAYIEKWVVGPRMRMGLFAKRDIQKGEEICFDYKADRLDSKPQKCLCGEPNCVGLLGTKSKSGRLACLPEEVVDGLSLLEEDVKDWVSEHGGRRRKHLSADEAAGLPVKPLTKGSTSKVMGVLMQSREDWLVKKMAERIFLTTDAQVQAEVMRMHGYEIFSTILAQWAGDQSITNIVLETLMKWPNITKNKISSSSIEGIVQSLAESSSTRTSHYAKCLLKDWSNLEMAYRIPRRRTVHASKKQPKKRSPTIYAEDDSESESSESSDDSADEDYEDAQAQIPIRKPMSDLPKDWEAVIVPKTGKILYTNRRTGAISTNKPRTEREVREEKLRRKRREQELQRERERIRAEQHAAQLRREEEATNLRRIIEDAASASTPDSQHTTPRDTKDSEKRITSDTSSNGDAPPLKRKRSVTPEQSWRSLFASYVPKVVWNFEPILGHDRCRAHSRDIVNLLVNKELKREEVAPDSINDALKSRVKQFVAPYMEKVVQRRAERHKPRPK